MLHLNNLNYHQLEPFFHTAVLPVIQNIKLVVSFSDSYKGDLSASYHNAFLGSPHRLHPFLSFPEYLSLRIDQFGWSIKAGGPTLHKMSIVGYPSAMLEGPRINLLHHLLDMFPNLTRLCIDGACSSLLKEVDIASMLGIETLELSSARSEDLKYLKAHSSLPSLTRLILRDPVLESFNDDDWRTALDVLPESTETRMCTVITSFPRTFSLSNEIREDMSRRNIHFEIPNSSHSVRR
ncbi:MAG TPA: hypothetical protein VGO47_11465 [Chlamydiales bacterium]|nr:hypothetical protein [Chlamydiales bacterium]